ncbi:hypothetical protein [Mycolicibacterium obuense]|uniref:Uncharacterized protein n=1 Tax=Mycolicibacterium obuense TaxID=1807 RepID=A0A0M2K3Y3_9MYCO|nr:hypothetical protein [Mycolicibacterium obuense]KKF01935.1 hypothetical protein WN67_11005 [Mycolicibacterium obuense]
MSITHTQRDHILNSLHTTLTAELPPLEEGAQVAVDLTSDGYTITTQSPWTPHNDIPNPYGPPVHTKWVDTTEHTYSE